MKNQRVLVTGATGFVGSHLTRRLVHLGAQVHAWAGSEKHLNRIADLQNRLHLKILDIRNADQVRQACQEVQPEIIFHLAAYGVNYDEQSTEMAVAVNVGGTVHLLQALRGISCTRIVATGTWAEYGPKDHPIQESESLEPVGVYGCTKAASTLTALGLAAQERLPLVLLRPFSVYGPGEGDHKFIPTIIQSCLDQETPRLSSCRQIRDYIFVEDVVEAYLKAAVAELTTPVVINIGSGTPVPLKEIVSMILKHFQGLTAAFGAIPDRPSEIWQVEADISNAKKQLGWQPSVPLEQGIRLTVNWFRSQRNGND